MARKSGRAALVLTAEQVAKLKGIAGSRTAPTREVDRAKVLLGYLATSTPALGRKPRLADRACAGVAASRATTALVLLPASGVRGIQRSRPRWARTGALVSGFRREVRGEFPQPVQALVDDQCLAAFYRLGPEAKTYAQELLRVAGPDRLVWASDCPFVGHEGQFTYQSTIDWLIDAIPDTAARAKIFGATARELYFDGK